MGATKGCRFLLLVLDAEIHGVEQMLYDDHKKLAISSLIDEKKIY